MTEQPTPSRVGLGIRGRLAIMLLVVLVPLAVLVVLGQRHWETRTAALAVVEATSERLDDRLLERCLARPDLLGARGRRGRRGRRPARVGHLYAYDASYAPARADAPELDEGMRADLESQGYGWREVSGPNGRDMLQVALRTVDDGACSVILVERPAAPFEAPLWPPLLFSLLAIAAAFAAAGPLVRRVRRLTAAALAAQRGEAFEPDPTNDEIGALSRAFATDREELARRNEALERRERALTRFVSNTTHDVGIPLTVLQGHLVALRQRLGKSDDGKVLGKALEEAHYIGALIRNLAAAAKLDDPERHLVREPVDLTQLVERVAGRHEPLARAKGLSLDFATPDSPVELTGDLTLLEQAVGNLVHNAVRYNDGGGHVAVLLEVADGRFEIRVIDDGPGVSEADLARLGERRFRSDEARTRRPTGTGLGLSIARDVAERHGLTLAFANGDPHGLIATLSGPLR